MLRIIQRSVAFGCSNSFGRSDSFGCFDSFGCCVSFWRVVKNTNSGERSICRLDRRIRGIHGDFPIQDKPSLLNGSHALNHPCNLRAISETKLCIFDAYIHKYSFFRAHSKKYQSINPSFLPHLFSILYTKMQFCLRSNFIFSNQTIATSIKFLLKKAFFCEFILFFCEKHLIFDNF